MTSENDKSRAPGIRARPTQDKAHSGKNRTAKINAGDAGTYQRASASSLPAALRRITADVSGLPPRALFHGAAEAATENAASMAGAERTGIGSALRAVSQAARVELADVLRGIKSEYQRKVAAAILTAHPSELAGILRALHNERMGAVAIAKTQIVKDAADERQAIVDRSQGAERPRTGLRAKWKSLPSKPR